MQNAKMPGNTSIMVPSTMPCTLVRAMKPLRISNGPSTAKEMTINDDNMTGVRKKRVEKGLDVAG